MAIHEIIALVLTLTAAASYINYRFIKLPSPIGVTLLTILLAIPIPAYFAVYINMIFA